jgi:hypothetical protein
LHEELNIEKKPKGQQETAQGIEEGLQEKFEKKN